MGTYTFLFESILSKCQKDHWFGCDFESPRQYDGALEYDPNFDKQTLERISQDDPRRRNFEFPPASEEQLQETEKQLDFSLPPLLRELYATLANGGFGPGGGLSGVLNGYGTQGTGFYPQTETTLLALYQFNSQKGTFQLPQTEKPQDYLFLQIPYGEWPYKLLSLCDLGCVQDACVDEHERMFMKMAIEDDEKYGLFRLPWTLEEWLWRWVRGEMLFP